MAFIRSSAVSVDNLQLPCSSLSVSPNTARHDKLVPLVERMLELHKRSPRLPQEKESLQREIESTDGRIDRLVYELSPEGDDIWVE